MKKTAILVDGAFYRKRSFYLRGDKARKIGQMNCMLIA